MFSRGKHLGTQEGRKEKVRGGKAKNRSHARFQKKSRQRNRESFWVKGKKNWRQRF